MKCTDSSTFLDVMCKEAKDFIEPTQLLEVALSLRIPKTHLIQSINKLRKATLPNFSGLSDVLSEDQFATVWCWLPDRAKHFHQPELLFCGNKNGFNLNTMVLKCSRKQPLLLIVKSKTQSIFGAFISCSMEKEMLHYRGSGEMFLFRLSPGPPKKYCWTKANSFFFLIDGKPTIMIGGGSGCGLMLDDELDQGMSNFCETFNNEPLNGDQKNFHSVAIEVYGFQESASY